MPNTEAKALTTQLNSLSRQKREEALNQIRAMPHGKAVGMMIALGNIISKLRSNDSLFSLLPISVIMAINMPLTLFLLNLKVLPYFGVALLIITLTALHAMLWNKAIKKYHGNWVYPLFAEYEDALLVVPALKGWKEVPPSAYPFFEACLTRNLPSLTPEAASAMSASEHNTLRNLLLRRDPELCKRVLNTLSRLEDTLAIPNVETLLKRRIGDEVRAEAEACLEKLNATKAAERENKVLLRASHNTEGMTTLLRMADAAKPEDERQLLRSGKGERER